MKYWIVTFGCQMNKSDSERIAAALEDKGYQLAPGINGADLVVVNMCSVRQSAVDRIYGLLPKFQKLKIKNSCLPEGRVKLKIILTGCILKKDRIKFAEYFDEIIDIRTPAKAGNLDSLRYKYKNLKLKELTKKVKPKYSNKFSAFVPIMTGCNNFCAYCVVPYTRGREISRPSEEITCEVKNLVKRGVKEIWLLGQNVNSYEYGFPKLLGIINKIPGKFWIRFTSSHPKDFSDDLIKVMKSCKKITPYLNLPVQAGDDKVLKKMNRPYTVKKYKNIIKKVKKEIPDIAISTDVIVGFPEETKKQFENTVKLFKEIKYDMAYIARYSPRLGTTAARLKDNVPQKEKDRREKVLTEILKQTALKNNQKYIGKTVEVLMTGSNIGKTKTNKTVKFQVPNSKLQGFVKIKITDALPWGLKGKLC